VRVNPLTYHPALPPLMLDAGYCCRCRLSLKLIRIPEPMDICWS